MVVDFTDVYNAGENVRWLCEFGKVREVLKFVPKKRGEEADVEYKAGNGQVYRQDGEEFANRAVRIIK